LLSNLGEVVCDELDVDLAIFLAVLFEVLEFNVRNPVLLKLNPDKFTTFSDIKSLNESVFFICGQRTRSK